MDEVVDNTSDINEYLLGEVLDAQPPEVRCLLLAASVPDTLFPELVDELAGPGARLSSCLRRLNAFLEPVSGAPGCQRYHPFFRDLLRAQLAYESPDLLVDLHRRAGTWLVRQGLLDAGVSHLVAAGLREAAATAVIDGLALERLLLCRDDDPIVRAFGSEPVAPAGPAEQLVRAGVALGRGRHAECHRLLAAARLAIPSEGREEGSEEGTPNRARLDAAAALLDAVRARDHESPDEAAALADRATHLLDRLDGALVTEHPELTALVTSCRGVAQLRAGRLAEAARTLAGGAATAPGGSPERLHALGHLALVEALEGRLSQAADNAALALGEEVEGATDGVLQSSAGEVALAVVSLERMDLDAADSHLRAANRGRTSPVCRGLAAITEAGVHQSRGHVDKAMEVIAAARADLRDDDEWLDRRVALEAARVRVSAGSARQALADLSGVEQEPEASVLAAQAHLREGRHQEVASCLEQARETEVPLHARIVSILVEAAHESHRRSPARTRGLVKQSLRLAASERMRRPFLEAPSDIQRLLHHDPQLATHAAWLARHPVRATPATSAHRGSTSPGAPAPRAPAPVEGADLPAVVEPLTTKELEVLGHLAELLSTQEIAATMFISVNTVRTHVRNILRKLGVSRRSAAVRRARQLQIV